MAKFKPPTKQEMVDYAKMKNLNVDADWLWNMWDAGDWIKANGEAIQSWKQTMWTHHRCNEERGMAPACQICRKRPAPYIKGQNSDGNAYHYCHTHKPLQPPAPPQIAELAQGIGKIPPEDKPEPAWKQYQRLKEK